MQFIKSGVVAFALMVSPALAIEPSWPDLRASLYEGTELLPAGQNITIDVPYRTEDDTRTQIAVHVDAPEQKLLSSVTLILDENPMPVSAVLRFDRPLPRFFFEATMRINGPTPVHVIAETTDGQHYVAEGFVKTSGTGACSAPPGTDPELALATLGEMTISVQDRLSTQSAGQKLLAVANGEKNMSLDISHPSHSGMQMDQISLLFIPMRYVQDIEIDLDGQGFVDVTGSISLSENPELTLSVPANTRSVDVTMTDTDGAVSHASKLIAGY